MITNVIWLVNIFFYAISTSDMSTAIHKYVFVSYLWVCRPFFFYIAKIVEDFTIRLGHSVLRKLSKNNILLIVVNVSLLINHKLSSKFLHFSIPPTGQ